MTPRFFASLTDGPARYEPETPWAPVAAILAVIAIILSVSVLVDLFLLVLAVVQTTRTGSEPQIVTGSQSLSNVQTQILFGLQQALTIGLTVLAAYMYAGRPKTVLALHPVPRGVIIQSVIVLLAVSLFYTAVVFVFAKEAILKDLAPFAQALNSENWIVLALAVAIGAPLSEELLFRGFLFSALSKTRLGIIGTALLTNSAWTVLHFHYSIYGLIDVFLVGLVLSWLLWRTGSLWVTIAAHAIYNSIVLIGLWLAAHNDWLPTSSSAL
ncbi:MAG: lysostaphin resistance A-like protein [Hyphomicrobiaceae bacterium]